MIIAIILLSILLNQLTKPLRTLQTAMRDIAQGEGDLTKRLTIINNDEIGKLENSFNTMASNIKSLLQTQFHSLEKAQRADEAKSTFLVYPNGSPQEIDKIKKENHLISGCIS